MLKIAFLVLFLSTTALLTAQETNIDSQSLPFYEMPEYPESYTAESVAARMIESLGFRFYWATEGLRPEDLVYRPGEEARTTEETIDHILGLSQLIVNSTKQLPNVRDSEAAEPMLRFAEKRKATLENLQVASELLRSGAVKLENCKLVFQNGERTTTYPFWNNINGPISDALWHTGQIVSFRRSSGNPFTSKVSVLTGKVKK